MTKFLKPKNMRRLALLATLAAPAVYLFGSLFAGLVGAHGEIVYADDAVKTEPVSNYLAGNYSYIVTFKDNLVQPSELVRAMDFNQDYLKCYTMNDVQLSQWSMSSSGIRWTYKETSVQVLVYEWETDWSSANQCRLEVRDFTQANSSGWLGVLRLWNPYVTIQQIVGDVIPDATSQAEFVFSQMFPEDNFISKLGDDVFTGNISSQPISQLITYVDSNMFEIGDTSIGRFVYGYTYYAITSVLIYEIVAIALSLLLLPLKVVDTLEKGEMS